MKTLILVTALAVAASACGVFQPTAAEREARTTRRITTLLHDVDATAEQQEQILATTGALRARFNEKRSPGARAVMLAQWNSAVPDEAALVVAIDESAARRIADAHAVVDAGARIHQTLTAAQRVQLEEQLPLKKVRFVAGLVQKVGYGPPTTRDELVARAGTRFATVLDEINATDEQRAALQPLLAAVIDDAASLLSTPEALKDAAVFAWQSDDADVKALHALIDAEGEQATLAAHSAAAALVKAHAILNVEQRAALAAHLQRGGHPGQGAHGSADPLTEVSEVSEVPERADLSASHFSKR